MLVKMTSNLLSLIPFQIKMSAPMVSLSRIAVKTDSLLASLLS